MFAFFQSLVKPFPPEQPGQPPNSLFAFCYHYTKDVKGYLLIMAVLTSSIAIVEVSLFGFLGQLVDWLAVKERATFWQEEKYNLLFMGVVILVALPTCVVLHSMVVHQVLMGNYPMRIRWQAHRFLLGQSISFFQDEFAGRIGTKVMQTSLAVREAVMKLLDVLLYVVVYFVGMVSVVATADWRLSFPLLIWIVIYISMLAYFIPRFKRIAETQADARAEMTGRIVDTYTNIHTVKLFSHSKREADYSKEAMNGFLQTVYPMMNLASQLNISLWILNAINIFTVCALSVYLWSTSAIATGAIAVVISLSLRLQGLSQWIMWETSMLFENLGTVRDGANTLSLDRDVQDQADAKDLHVTQGLIEFTDVTFSYEEENKQHDVFDGLSLTIQPGEKIGLVGRSGAGKSSLVNLLLRFHDLQSGSIQVDGQAIHTVKQESLRANIGMVTQDTSLLHRSVRENILYGRPQATDEEMILAAKQAEAHDFIMDLADAKGRNAYDAHVGERGVKLSGGQRQRIAIARVLLKNAPILILDEATSALDSEVESFIQRSLYTLMEDKTVIAIAHRLSTIAEMDRLIVLDEGKIIEQGSHQELIDKKGIYSQLWSHQSGGFIGVDTEK